MLVSAELTLWLLAFASAIYAKLYRNYVAVVCFLGIKLGIAATYSFFASHYPAGSAGSVEAYRIYYDIYWVAYLLATIAAFFSIKEIIRTVLSPLPGVSRLAVLIFHFTGLLTFFIAGTAHLPELKHLSFFVWINALFISIALCMCVFEVSLMSMLISAAPRLGLSFRTRLMGLSLGLCFLGIMDFLSLTAWVAGGGAWGGLSRISEIVVDGTLVMWILYFLLPDQKRGPTKLSGSSTLMRWNEIVSQLGLGPQPMTDMAPSFMSDVESLVDGIMMRNRHL